MADSDNTFKIEIPFEDFQKHLGLKDNYRIIFSGIFGIGKTTYIKDFFGNTENKEKYEAIHLFPVNYSVASNEDIFELVKFDILFQLLTKEVSFKKIDIPNDLTLIQFAKNNFANLITPFLNFIPVIGGSISKVSEELIELKEKYESFHKEIQGDEIERANKFLNSFTNLKGSIYEEDFYTSLIQNLISQLKDKNKEVVLIIDDLDRIDPEHIFRLLNVFAAHVDIDVNDEKENKFGFDKVIFVCDIENIRNIYRHKYGVKTDFNGYIDKFYSRGIFKFNAEKVIGNYLNIFIGNLKSNFYEGKSIRVEFEKIEFILRFVILNMLLNSGINLRDLFRSYNRGDLNLPYYRLTDLGFHNIVNTELRVLLIYDILNIIFGFNFDKILRVIDICSKGKMFYLEEYNMDLMIADIIIFEDMENHNFSFKHQNSPQLKFRDISYELERYSSRSANYYYGRILNYEKIEHKINYFNLLYECFIAINRQISNQK